MFIKRETEEQNTVQELQEVETVNKSLDAQGLENMANWGIESLQSAWSFSAITS